MLAQNYLKQTHRGLCKNHCEHVVFASLAASPEAVKFGMPMSVAKRQVVMPRAQLQCLLAFSALGSNTVHEEWF